MLDTISAYQNNGIDAINELICSTIDDEVKSQGLNLIKKIKQNSTLFFLKQPLAMRPRNHEILRSI